MREETQTYKDKDGYKIVAIFFDDKVQYKSENKRYTKVVPYKTFLSTMSKMGWKKC